jgi:hypothetical protein
MPTKNKILIPELDFSIPDLVFPKKIYRFKEDQAFSLSLELGRREKVVRHPICRFPPPNLFSHLFVL